MSPSEQAAARIRAERLWDGVIRCGAILNTPGGRELLDAVQAGALFIDEAEAMLCVQQGGYPR